jgi:hypothetical protein
MSNIESCWMRWHYFYERRCGLELSENLYEVRRTEVSDTIRTFLEDMSNPTEIYNIHIINSFSTLCLVFSPLTRLNYH